MAVKPTRRHVPPIAPIVLPPHVRGLLGEQADELLAALHGPSPVSIRLNPRKLRPREGEPVPWCTWGRYLPQRPVFTLDPLLHAGAYYVQEASSMLLEQAYIACTGLPEQAVVLDLCAAPGGKSTHLAALLPDQALLISNEPVATRVPALSENLWKWGRPDTVITSAPPEHFRPMGAWCDLVLVDAPCSGEGMFRKDPHARAQWGPNLVQTCAARQHTILDAAWTLVKPGGYLIYSTCTWETSENEDQVARLVRMGAIPVPVPAPEQWGVVASGPGLRCYPHRLHGEGFFIAVVQKPADGTAEGHGLRVEAALVPTEIAAWLRDPQQLWGTAHEGVFHAAHRRWSGLIQQLLSVVKTIAPGVPVAQQKGKAWSPHPALALNGILEETSHQVLDLDRPMALRYLRGEAIPATAAQGTARVRFDGLGVGWVHGAGNRWNNQWPAAWRIRMR